MTDPQDSQPPSYDTTEAAAVFLRAHEKATPAAHAEGRKAAVLALHRGVLDAAREGLFVVVVDEPSNDYWIGLPSRAGGSLMMDDKQVWFFVKQTQVRILFEKDISYDPVTKLFVGPFIEAGKPERRNAVTVIAEKIAAALLEIQKSLHA